MSRFKKIERGDVLFISGGLAVTVGIGLIYLPAAVIFLGLFLVLISLSIKK